MADRTMLDRLDRADKNMGEPLPVEWVVALVCILLILMFVIGFGAGARHADSQSRETVIRHSIIGGNEVPNNLQCEEDEVIGFVVTDTPPFNLGCVHIDTFASTQAP